VHTPATLLAANERYAAAHGIRDLSAVPSRQLAIVTCMDTRIDALDMVGLDLGEAHVLRNAGARLTEDVLRSLAVSVHVLGVRHIALIQHTDCGMAQYDDEGLRALVGADLDFHTIDDHAAAIADDLERLARAPFLRDVVQSFGGYLFDVRTGRLSLVTER
jgi:carbonic anhydrase